MNFKGLACSSNTLRFHLVIKIILQFNQTKLWLSRATEKQTKKLALNKRGFDDLWLVHSSSYAAAQSDGRCWCRFIMAVEVSAGAAAVMKAQDNSVHHCRLATLRRMNTLLAKGVTISVNTVFLMCYLEGKYSSLAAS